MDTFWDTSAVVALLLQEPDTQSAQAIWSTTTRPWAWRWMVIETEAALSRRKAPPAAWTQLANLLETIRLLDLDPERWDSLRAFNRALRLRAADAAHLFVCERANTVIPGLHLVSFDAEQVAAARGMGLSVL